MASSKKTESPIVEETDNTTITDGEKKTEYKIETKTLEEIEVENSAVADGKMSTITIADIDVLELKGDMIKLGIALTEGLINRNRFPSQQEVDSVNALCRLYEVLNINN